MSKSKPITAAELMNQLQTDKNWQSQSERHHQNMSEADAKYRSEVAPILNELKDLGLDADLYDLVQKYGPVSKPAVQILLGWIVKADNEKILEGIVRSLSSTTAPYDGAALVSLFEKSDSQILRWVIANTIAESKPINITKWLTDAVLNPDYGKAREMLILAAARIFDQQTAILLLKKCANDFPGYVAIGIRECGNNSHVNFLKNLRTSAKSWEKREIEKTIRLLELEG